MRQRFAPSPTGLLHLGHAFSALTAWDICVQNHGTFLLRIEDIDQSRCRPEFEASILKDLEWLGIFWRPPLMRQSERMDAYRTALQSLHQQGLLYACNCTRADISAALSAPQEGAQPGFGPDGPVYPGTCRKKSLGLTEPQSALRLNMAKAVERLSDFQDLNSVGFEETGTRPGQYFLDAEQLTHRIGDVVLARKDIGTSYHLAVVVDDAAQGITHVTRGEDMFAATFIHCLIQALLGMDPPIYHHHRLIRDPAGKRLAKRFDSMAIEKYRRDGLSPTDIRSMVGI